MALNIDEIISALRDEKIDPKILVAVETKLEKIEQDKKADRSSTPKGKNEFVIMVRGDAALKKILQQGWVVQVKKGSDIQNLPIALQAAAKDNNDSQKKKKAPVKTWRELFQYCKRPFLKNRDILVKTKEPVQVVVLLNEGVDENTA